MRVCCKMAWAFGPSVCAWRLQKPHGLWKAQAAMRRNCSMCQIVMEVVTLETCVEKDKSTFSQSASHRLIPDLETWVSLPKTVPNVTKCWSNLMHVWTKMQAMHDIDSRKCVQPNDPSAPVVQIRRPLVAVRGSAPRKLLQKIVVERWGTWRARLGTSSCCGPVGTALLKAPARIRCFVRLVCCFAWLEHESCCCSSVSKALLHGTSSCCGPVGTALPKAPARIRCFVQLVCGFAWFGHYFFLFKLFNGFRQRRFGIFSVAVSRWLGHKTCCGSAFSHARPKHLLEFGLVACRFFLCF